MSDWRAVVDKKSGRTYYYNKVTKKTSWTKPAEMDGAPAPSAPQPKPKQEVTVDPANVAANWRSVQDKNSGRTYYYNSVTKKTSWTKPPCMEASSGSTETKVQPKPQPKPEPKPQPKPVQQEAPKQQAAVTTGPPTPAAANPNGVPADWTRHVDKKSGRSYYYNKKTKKTSWKAPFPELENATVGNKSKSTGVGRGSVMQTSSRGAALAAKVNASSSSEVTKVERKSGVEVANKEENEAKSATRVKNAAAKELLKLKQANQERAVKRGHLDSDEEDDGTGDKFRFAKHRKGWFNRTFRTGEVMDEQTILSYKKSLIKKALLKQNRNLDAEAIQAFKNVMSYMGDRKSGKGPVEHAQKILRNAMVAPAGLRDEIYMILIKQTTNNPRIESTRMGWQLLALCMSVFPPSRDLKRFISTYIKKHCEGDLSEVDKVVVKRAKQCNERLDIIMAMGQRKQVPSKLEIEAHQSFQDTPVTVELINGVELKFVVDPFTMVSDMEEQIVEKLQLVVRKPFALYEAPKESNKERILLPKQRVLDVLAAWENQPLVEELAVEQKVAKKTRSWQDAPTQKKKAEDTQFSRFLYKAKLVLKTTNPQLLSDPEAVNLIYAQAVSDVITSRYPSAEKHIPVLAALQLQATEGDYNPSKHTSGWLAERITDYMPARFVTKKNKINKKAVNEYEQKIYSKYAKVQGFMPLESKLSYLEYVQEWKFYGCSFFMVEQRQFKDYPSPLMIGINCEGVLLMHPMKKTVLEDYPYPDIVTWGNSDEKFITVVGNIVQQRKLIFKTTEGQAMNHLIHDYVKFKVQSNA